MSDIQLGRVQQKEPPKKALFAKQYKYRVHVEYSGDRDKYIQAIYKADPSAEVKPEGSWCFRVKTRMASAELFYHCTTQAKGYIYGGIDKITKIFWF